MPIFNRLKKQLSLQTYFIDWLLNFLQLKLLKPKNHLVGSYLKKYFLIQTNLEEFQFYRFLQFTLFIMSYSELEKKEILNDHLYITVQFQLVDFIKSVKNNLTSKPYSFL